MPYIVRAPTGKETMAVAKNTPMKFIGDAYIHGLMKGEAMERISFKFEDIVLI